jgi:ferredoxin-type protein NapH
MEKARRLKTQAVKAKLLEYNTPRRVVQVLSFLFFSTIIFNLGVLPLVLPVLWTGGLIAGKGSTVGDAFTAIQLMFSGWGLIYAVFPWIALASFLIVGVLIGRSLCGWVCPFGLVQDLAGFIRRKHADLSSRTHESMVYVKYIVLAIALLIPITFSAASTAGVSLAYQSAFGVFAQAPFTALSPSDTLFSTVPKAIQGFHFSGLQTVGSDILNGLSILPALFWVQFAILIGVLIFAVYVPRSWCRYFCPTGAFLAVMNRFSFIGLRREPFKCEKGGCRECVQVCPTRVPILELPWEKFSHPECIYCMKCADACEHKAIKLTYP